jgi:hypothetical protein
MSDKKYLEIVKLNKQLQNAFSWREFYGKRSKVKVEHVDEKTGKKHYKFFNRADFLAKVKEVDKEIAEIKVELNNLKTKKK